MDEIEGVEELVRDLIRDQRKTHRDVSINLQNMFPGVRGLSEMSVRRYCYKHGIHRTSRVDDAVLDHLVSSNVAKIGPHYGRKTMTGLLASQGWRVAQSRVGASFTRVSPVYLAQRSVQSHQGSKNPVPYTSRYFGEKVHVDQNEKLVLFGVTHICAIDGYSGKIVAFCSMPVKNNISIYENIYMRMTSEFGLWDQIRVDCGREWYLMLFMQEHLSHFRNDPSKPPHLRSSSKNNHMVERIWVEVNTRINYPIKETLIKMMENGEISLDDQMCKFCVSWYTLRVANIGISLLISSWNEHPISSSRNGLLRGVPNQRMQVDNRTKKLTGRTLLAPADVALLYRQNGGHLTDPTFFGQDPLAGDQQKYSIREEAFATKFPSFDPMFHQTVNGNDHLFREGLKCFIDITRRLACT